MTQAKGWVHDVVHDGYVDANPPQAAVAAPALPVSPKPACLWNNCTTIGGITQFPGSGATIHLKTSTVVARHHSLLQQCHHGHGVPPEEEQGDASSTPNGNSGIARIDMAGPRLDTTEVPTPLSPPTATGALDLQCPRDGIRDFYSPQSSTWGNNAWDADAYLAAPMQAPSSEAYLSPVVDNQTFAFGH